MKPLFSDEERVKAVKNFVVARYQHLAKIEDYSAIVPYLEENRVKILCKLERSGSGIKNDDFTEENSLTSWFTKKDAEIYFEWLVAVVTGTQNASGDMIKQANDQLFQFINVLGDHVQMDKSVQILAPYDWQALFTSFDDRLTDMQRIIDKGDKAIIEVLNPLLEFMKKNTKLLEILYKEHKENERIFRKGK